MTVDRRSLRLIVAALLAAVLLSSLDAMIFNTALPTIVGQLHGIARMSWVPTAYLLTTVITLSVYGKLGDLPGRKWLFVAALTLFLAGSVVGGLAGSMSELIAARSRAWAAAASWCCRRRSAITAAVTLLQPAPVTARQRLAEIGLAPVPPRLLADRDFVLATVGALCGAVAMFGTVGYLPTYLQMADRLTPTSAGVHMVPVVLGIGTTAFASGYIMSRTGRYAWMLVAGAVIVADALAVLWSLRISTSPWLVSADAYLFGAGMGFGMQTLTIVAQPGAATASSSPTMVSAGAVRR
jgi:Major Facilitator Superfamily